MNCCSPDKDLIQQRTQINNEFLSDIGFKYVSYGNSIPLVFSLRHCLITGYFYRMFLIV